MMFQFKTYKHTVQVGMAALTAVLLLTGCNNSTVYHSYQGVDAEGWGKHDTLYYQLPKDSIPDTYSIKIGLRITEAYRYTSLWLVMEQDLGKKGIFIRDTINIPTTDKSGNILGNGFSSHQQEIKVKDIPVNPGSGSTIKLYHIMKREVITGISDVGINVLSDSLQRLSSRK